MSEREKKQPKFSLAYSTISPEWLFYESGKHIGILVGAAIIIQWMVEFYINSPLDLKANSTFTLGYMLAILLIPLAISYYTLELILGENNK